MIAAVLLAMSGLVSASPPSVVSDVPSPWVHRAHTDVMTDERRPYVQNASGEHSLVFGCNTDAGRQLNLQVRSTSYFGSSRGYNYLTVRIDQGQAIGLSFEAQRTSRHSVAVLFEVGTLRPLVRSIANGTRMLVRATDAYGQPINMAFNLHGGEAAINRVLAECGQPDWLAE